MFGEKQTQNGWLLFVPKTTSFDSAVPLLIKMQTFSFDLGNFTSGTTQMLIMFLKRFCKYNI
jgi:hypothetical protein